MSIGGVELVWEPTLAGPAVLFVAGGVLLGTVSGLIPGLHANNFAMLLAAMAPAMPGPPLLVGMAMIAAGVVHTFLDVVPALALGVPDAEMAVMALPGHRLVLEGRGREAIRLSAMGSGLAVCLALPFAIPVTALMTAVWPFLDAHMPVVVGTVAALMVATEAGWRSRFGGLVTFCVSAGLGLLTLDVSPEAPLGDGGVLTPLFAGLFGAPVLIDAITGGGVPRQADAGVDLSGREVMPPAVAGALAGAFVGYLPGVSSAIAAVMALLVVPGEAGDRGFIVATSGVNTSNTVFALFALVALGSPRTGVLVAVNDAGVPLNLPMLLGSVLFAAAAAFVTLLAIGDRYLTTVGRLDYAALSMAVLALLGALSFLFSGSVGVLIFVIAIAIGFVPVRLGAKRVHLMGVLMGPIMIGW